jgi:hypothetical protein
LLYRNLYALFELIMAEEAHEDYGEAVFEVSGEEC